MSARYIDIIIPCGDSLEELKVTLDSLLSQAKFINNIFIVVSGINKKNLKIKMIPEIWQGHLNNGAKFANSIIRFSEKLSEINQ